MKICLNYLRKRFHDWIKGTSGSERFLLLEILSMKPMLDTEILRKEPKLRHPSIYIDLSELEDRGLIIQRHHDTRYQITDDGIDALKNAQTSTRFWV